MSTATVTAKIGPGLSATALVFNNVTSFNLNCDTNVLRIVHDGIITDLDVAAATTYTLTITSGVYSLTVT